MENSGRAFLYAVGKSMRQTKQAVVSNVVDPKLFTYAERLQYEGYLRRQETNEAIRVLSATNEIISPLPNLQTEGQTTRLKLINYRSTG
ncbi:iSL3 family transposase (plasmid) [Sinorhizobium sp. RAC02]|nr:iSL3 family transposase [Sinorhizobium sp. RAC02]